MSRGGRAGGLEGTFELEREEHETGGALGLEGATLEELEPEKSFLPEPKADKSGKDSSDGESMPELDQVGHSGAHQEVPATVRKLYDLFTRAPQPITQSRTRSGRDATSLQAPMRAVEVNHLPPEPLRSAKQRRPRNAQTGSAREKAKWTENSRARYGR